ncbi:MAG: DUF4340 domain-containing protein, partial [Planctomycetaceae bacterium]
MNTETRNTLCFAGAAVVSVVLALVVNSSGTPSQGNQARNLGKPFYSDFSSLNAKSLKLVVFNEGAFEASTFEVKQQPATQLYVIPSHHDYPADAEGRLAKTAASMNGITRGYLQSQNKKDHEKYGVLDPTEANSFKKGLGRRVTLKDTDNTVLADYIIGMKVENANSDDSTERYYVRTPDDDDVYIAECKIDLSAKFADWIESDLLKVEGDDITHLTVDNYSFDEKTLTAADREVSTLSRKDFSDKWKLEGIKDETEEVDADKLRELVSSLDDLKIVGVRPKPEGLKSDLSLDLEFIKSQAQYIGVERSLQLSGFFAVRKDAKSTPKVFANAGEVHAATKAGIVYSLLFGEVFTGSDLEIESGFDGGKKKKDADKTDKAEKKDGKAEKKDTDTDSTLKTNRYLLVRARFDPSYLEPLAAEPVAPKKPAPKKPAPKKPAPKKPAPKKPAPK